MDGNGLTDDVFQRLLGAARRGEEWAVALLWRELHPLLLRYLQASGPEGAAEDLASDVWIELARGLQRFQGGPRELRAWAFTVARHRAIDARRAARRRPAVPLVDDGGSVPGPAHDAEARRALDAAVACLRRLPPDQAEVVLLRVLAGLEVADVAAIMGKRPGTVRVLHHRALRALRRQLKARGVTDEGVGALFTGDDPLTA